jgi:hypothetical protein
MKDVAKEEGEFNEDESDPEDESMGLLRNSLISCSGET